MPTTNKHEWKDILKKVYQRASNDHQFRELCLKDGRAAIQQVTGKELPKEFKIRFVDEAKEIVLMLPKEGPGHKLSDSELETIAGAGAMSLNPPIMNLGHR